MSRRLAVVMVLVVAAALAFAGLGSLLFARNTTAANDRRPLLTQASSIATVIDRSEAASVAAVTATGKDRALLRRLSRDVQLVARTTEPIDCAYFLTLSAATASIASFNPTTSCSDSTTARVTGILSAEDRTALAGKLSVSFATGNDAFAYVPLALSADLTTALSSVGRIPAGTVVVLALVEKGSLPASTGRYFLGAALISLIVAAIVAVFLARRIARPIAVAAATTKQMAAGDLDARVPIEKGDYPELTSLATAINAMAESLSKARGRERQFLLSISHDLRTPLTSIRGYAEGVLDGAVDDPRKAASVILSESRRLERLIADLLDLARLDANRFAIDVRRTDLDEVARTSADGLRLALEEAGLALTVEADPGGSTAGPLLVAADPDRLSQVVANLVDNASRFASSSVHVFTLAAALDPRLAVLVVEDDGPGIAPSDLPHVFERFYTSDRRPGSDRRGSGLGLAIVSELVGAMGGGVRAVSPTGSSGGTRIEVTLRKWVAA